MADHAPSTPTPPGLRRHLAGAVLLPLAGTAVTILPVQPDAELICLCAEIDALEDFLAVRGRHEGKPGGPEEDEYDELVATVWKQQKELTDRICALPCISLAGLCAIGSTLALSMPPTVVRASKPFHSLPSNQTCPRPSYCVEPCRNALILSSA